MIFISKKRKIVVFFICLMTSIISSLIIFSVINNKNKEQVYENNIYKDGEKIEIEIFNDSNNFKTKVEVELAISNLAHYKGLSDRESLDYGKGMFFIFNNSSYLNFVMRRMNFPLDIIFINDNKILNIYKNLEAEGIVTKNNYKSLGLSNMVLEVPAGYSDIYNLEIGDNILIKNN